MSLGEGGTFEVPGGSLLQAEKVTLLAEDLEIGGSHFIHFSSTTSTTTTITPTLP
jgi:hypothetical protein